MALPKIKHTLFEHYLTGLKKKVQFRAFTNQEQKALLIAKENKGKDEEFDSVLLAIKQIITNCTLGKVDVDNLSIFDLEDLFLRIRSKSVSDVSTIKYRYDYTEDGKKLSKFIEVTVNLDDVKVQTNEKHTNKIQLTDEVGIVMKYPTFSMMNIPEEELPIHCIDYIYDRESIYSSVDSTIEELTQFYNDIDIRGMLKIKEFFDTMPKIRYSTEVDLGNGEKETIVLERLEDFFS
jgi:hypothetical protein